MGINPVTYYEAVCDYTGCGFKTRDLGHDYAAWADEGQALDDWTESDGYHDEKTGRILCEEHRPPTCKFVRCDEDAVGLDKTGDPVCKDHWPVAELPG